MAWTERYCRGDAAGGGDGTTNTNSGVNGAWTIAEAITNAAAGMRINIVQAGGVIASTTTTRTFATSGTTTQPIWWRGCNSSAGDIDTNNALAKPQLTFTTGQFLVNGSYNYFSNLDISGAQTTSGQVRFATGSRIWMDRCRVECTAANASGRAVSVGSSQVVLSRCWFKSTSSAEVVSASTSNNLVVGCALVGGNNGILLSGGNSLVVAFCSFNAVGGDALRSTAANSNLFALCNTIYSPGSDGFEQTVDPTTGIFVFCGNIFANCGGWGINSSIGTNTGNIFRLCNDFYNNSSGTENGVGDSPSLSQQTESSTPFANPGTDLGLVSTSNAKANSFPAGFENQSYTSYLDIGAVQRQEPAGSGGLLQNPGLDGGLRG